MILVVLPEGGCWRTLSALRKCGGDKSQRELGGGGGAAGEETVEDRKTTDLPAVRESEVQRLSLIAGDANDPKCLGFHSVKPRNVGRQEHQPRGESSTPSGSGRKLCMWSGAQVGRGRTLRDGGFPAQKKCKGANIFGHDSLLNKNLVAFNQA